MQFTQEKIQQLKRVQALLDRLRPDTQPQVLLMPGSPRPRATTIVFPGSFNPPTNAHLALLQQAQQFATKHESTSLYAAISKQTVDKEGVERPTWLDRIDLLNTVLHTYLQNTGILLFNRGLYVEQAQALHTTFPEIEHSYFLLGFDKVVQIFDPRYYEDRDTSLHELFDRAELLVAPRGNDSEKELNELLARPENERFAHYVHPLPLDARYRSISSTRIREGKDRNDIPPEVEHFMQETHAYDTYDKHEPPIDQAHDAPSDAYAKHVREMNALLGR